MTRMRANELTDIEKEIERIQQQNKAIEAANKISKQLIDDLANVMSSYMTEHTYLQCWWRERDHGGMRQCHKLATTCVVYGCLEGHINELLGCEYHFNLWVDLIADQSEACNLRSCPGLIDSWERTPVPNLTSGFALYMRTRQ